MQEVSLEVGRQRDGLFESPDKTARDDMSQASSMAAFSDGRSLDRALAPVVVVL
jgi:hypothetical protein